MKASCPIYKLIVLTFVALGAFTGCRSKKQVVTLPEETVTIVEVPGYPSAGDTVFAAANGAWATLEAPVQLQLTSPKNFGIGGRAKMIKGKEMLLSLRFIGMEVAVIYANTDSIFALEKMSKWYYAESIERFTGKTGFTLSDIQGYLLGRPTRMLPEVEGMDTEYIFTPAAPGVSGISLSRPANWLEFTVLFEDFLNTATGPTARKVDFSATLRGRNVAAQITWNLNEAKWNSGITDAGFRRPGSNYRRITTEQLLKSLITLGQ